MPVYISKGISSVSSASLSEPGSDEEEFLEDPELLEDLLPQPYRMIVKLVDGFIDATWNVIEERSKEFSFEKSRVLPKSNAFPAVKVEDLENVQCIDDSKDERYLFVGTKRGLVCIDPIKLCSLDKWEQADLEIVSLNVTLIGVQIYLLATIDDMGVARLFAFCGERFYLLKCINDQEGDKKVFVIRLRISREGEYVSCVLQNSATQEVWLEIHRIPRDAWINELESAISKMSALKGNQKVAAEEIDASLEQSTEPGAMMADAMQNYESSRREVKLDNSTTDTLSIEDRSSIKFSTLAIVLKVKAPLELTGSGNGVSGALKNIDQHSDVIGNGSNHLLSSSHLEQRRMVFEMMHQNEISYVSQEHRAAVTSYPEVFYVPSGRALPFGLDQPTFMGKCTTATVWWSGDNHVYHHSLLKQAKDVEHHYDLMWTTETAVTAVGVSSCGSLMGVGLASGNFLLYDMHLGLLRRATRICEEAIVCVEFLNPSVCSTDKSSNMNDPERSNTGGRFSLNFPYTNTVKAFVMCTNRSLRYYLLRAAAGEIQEAQLVETSAKHPSEQPCFVKYSRVHPDVALRVTQTGHVVLQDVLRNQELLQCQLPLPYNTAQPWAPVLAFAGLGQCLFLKGVREEEEADNGEVGVVRETSALFCFPLKKESQLKSYWSRQSPELPCYAHVTAEKRADALLAQRLASHSDRQNKLQQCWSQLRSTLAQVQQRKCAAKRNVDSAYSGATSVSRLIT